MNRASNLCVALVAIASGCGGAQASPTRAAPSAEAHAPSEPVATSMEPVASGVENMPVETVSWTFLAPLSIDPAGRAHADREVLGTFVGDALADGGEEVARFDADGRLFLRGVRTSMRVVGSALHDDRETQAFLRIEGDVLVLDETNERVPITHFRPEQTRRVLLVTAVALAAMARAYQH